MESSSFIYLLEPRWSGLDNFYKVFITKNALYGGKISSQFFSEESLDDLTINQAVGAVQRILAKLIKDHILRKKEIKENEYETISGKDDFLKIDRNNFIIDYSDIIKSEWNKRRSWWTARHNNRGTLTLSLKSDKHRKFIIIDQTDIEGKLKQLNSVLKFEMN